MMLSLIFCTGLSLAAPAAEPAAMPSYNLDQVMARFRSQGFDLLMAEAEVMGTRADARAAAQWTNPTASVALSHAGRPYRASLCPPGQCSATGWMLTLTDQAGVLDVLTGKHDLRRQLGQDALQSAQQQFFEVQRQLEASVKAQYLAVALDQAEVAFSKQASSSYAEGLALFRDRFEAGDISEADLMRVEVEVLDAEQREDAASARLVDDRLGLSLLMGERGEAALFEVDAPWLQGGDAEALLHLAQEEFVRIALNHRPDLEASVYQEAKASTALRLMRRQRLPDTTLGFNYQQFGTGQNAIQPRTYTGTLTLALPVLYQQQGEVARAEANARQASLQVEKARSVVRHEVNQAHTALRFAWSRTQRAKGPLMAHAKEALALVRLQYTKGAASLLDLLDAQRTYSRVNLEYLATLGDFWLTVIGLERALGTEVRL